MTSNAEGKIIQNYTAVSVKCLFICDAMTRRTGILEHRWKSSLTRDHPTTLCQGLVPVKLQRWPMTCRNPTFYMT